MFNRITCIIPNGYVSWINRKPVKYPRRGFYITMRVMSETIMDTGRNLRFAIVIPCYELRCYNVVRKNSLSLKSPNRKFLFFQYTLV